MYETLEEIEFDELKKENLLYTSCQLQKQNTLIYTHGLPTVIWRQNRLSH